MGKVIAIANQKGGIGKTFISYHLSHYLANEKKKTLHIDIDPQGNSTSYMLKFDEEEEHEVPESNNLATLFSKKEANAIKPLNITQNLYLLGSDIELSSFEGMNDLKLLYILKKYIAKVQLDYDYIIIDCPPNLGIFTKNGLLAADYIFCPADPSSDSFKAIGIIKALVDELQEFLNPKLQFGGIILNAFNKITKADKAILEKLKDKYSDLLLSAILPLATLARKARLEKRPIFECDPKAKDPLTKNFIDLSSELLKITGE